MIFVQNLAAAREKITGIGILVYKDAISAEKNIVKSIHHVFSYLYYTKQIIGHSMGLLGWPA